MTGVCLETRYMLTDLITFFCEVPDQKIMNWSALFHKALKPRGNRWRILLWSCLAGVIFGTLGLGQVFEDILRDVRTGANQHAVSRDITLVAIDNRSLQRLGRYPWPRSHHAKLVTQLHEMGADQIVFTLVFADKSDAENDGALVRAIEPLGTKIVMPLLLGTGSDSEVVPLPELRAHASLATVYQQHDLFGSVRQIPYSMPSRRGNLPSLAAELAGVKGRSGSFPIDFSLDPRTIPVVSAVDVINGTADREKITGKRIIIGTTYTPLSSPAISPVTGIIPSVYVHILGAETLKEGPPLAHPWPVSFLPALLVASLCVAARRRMLSVVAIPAGILVLLGLPFFLEARQIYIEIVPPLFLLSSVGIALWWAHFRQAYFLRGTTNAVSGLPNLAALQQRKADSARALVAARVHNYAVIASTLPADAEKELVEQIAKRFTVGASDPILYQGDEGIFAWFAEKGSPVGTGSHLDALHTLFRSPVIVQGKQLDLKITFGFDTECERSNANRLASALVAADEAANEGAKWKQYDPSKFEDASWRLSLLSQLDAAIDAGDLWVAYQPKLDLQTGRIIGAEALARWTHPDKGPISPIEFILAAEESNRIEKLTQFVLERAIRAAAAINQDGIDFGISVNLSGRLIDDVQLVSVIRGMLVKHGLDPTNLTLEVTETFALSSNARNLKTLDELRELGVKLSVDDYGTGLSTLDYLQRIPATEIKIDKSFVMGMRESHGTKVMVNSTIQLAHSLGQKVVAEGVEDQETLDELARMNCDIAQGYLIGRPMTFRALSKKMHAGPTQQFA
jgi:diguanylate cyclase